ncbi:hypothetical protein DCAR_0312992 [Daucus carota subsp. sativus]|uniref:Ubiquitin-like protease family profile domain-containing protein n=1 Tax=Daucus carota subsp. sativus TaxID=79200 RepID=A0AAF1AVG4_DAUCS|nr:hypothetical protein DCAR_0312992 [Daucus carota subsp. sativus]
MKTSRMKRSFRAGGMSSGQRRSPRLSINQLKKRHASIDLGEKDNSPILDNMRRKKWVKATGFGWMLEFQMLCYVHRLSYNIVDAFDSQDCSLNLSAGRVKINEMVVHNVLGLPNGSEEIQLIGAERIDDSWDDQYESTQITPSMEGQEQSTQKRVDDEIDNDYLFQWKGRGCTKAHMRSLGENKMVETIVIDSWTCILNENEILRADTSPLRLFLTTETTLLFPVYNAAHHYIICYNIHTPRWEVLDNRVQTLSFSDTYGDLPWRLHECFCHFLECYNIPKYSQLVRLQPEVVSMEWQSMDNNIDCGVFVMRHLETYMGNIFKWKSGLRRERVDYFPMILISFFYTCMVIWLVLCTGESEAVVEQASSDILSSAIVVGGE